MEAIRLEKLTKRYKNLVAVDALSLTVQKGELLALLGVNGAGKTTTVKMLSGLVEPTEGDAFLDGKSICREMAEIKKKIAVSPQETAVALGLTVRENLELMCGIFGLSGPEKDAKISHLSEQFGLQRIMTQKAGKLSGGWQRRLSIAMALVGNPEILFLDEPTIGLDVLARSELWETIRTLKGRVTVVLTTHYMEEAEALSDRVAILKEGKLLICDTTKEIQTKAGAERLEEAFIRFVKGEVE